MREFAFAIPGDLETATGGYVYARRLIAALHAHGWQARVIALPGSYPYPTSQDVADTATALADVADDTPLVIDGLALGALPADILKPRARGYTALVHHPLADESGLTEPMRRAFRDSERAALARTRHVICTSHHTAASLARDYAVPADNITVAQPGTDLVAMRPPKSPTSEVSLLTVATLTPRKGHLDLIAALGGLRHLSWRCTFVGSRDRDSVHARAVYAAVLAHGLGEHIVFMDAVGPAQLSLFYRNADIFVLPSLHEGFGMAFAEAMSHGVPVIGCAAGAVPEVVPPEAGILVPPQSPDALREALARLIGDAGLRARMGIGAREAVDKLPRWDDTARIVAEALGTS